MLFVNAIRNLNFSLLKINNNRVFYRVWTLEPERQPSHLLSKVGPDLFADSLGHAHGGHSSGLRATHHAIASVAILMQVLCQLGGLPTARLPNNNHNAVVSADDTLMLEISQGVTVKSVIKFHLTGAKNSGQQYLIMLRSCCLTAKMGRYCLCSRRVFFLANSLLASLFSFMWSANFCSALWGGKRKINKP